MKIPSKVSLGVSPEVSLTERPDSLRLQSKAQARRASAGRYLARSGSVHNLQIRLPKDLSSNAARPVRVSYLDLDAGPMQEQSGGQATNTGSGGQRLHDPDPYFRSANAMAKMMQGILCLPVLMKAVMP